jgi:UDP-glucose 4-epimerase
MKTCLVTGAYGFVGRHVARAAARSGFRVAGLGHGNWTRDESRAWGLEDWRTDDVTLESLLTYGGTPDIIVHCAGSGSVAFSMTHPQQDFARTVVGTLAVLEFMRLSSPQTCLVLPSSAGVYGQCDILPISIDAPLRPTSPYGLHKKMAEELCQSYARHFSLSCTIVRLFSVYGIGLRKQLLWDACQKISAGEDEFFGTGREKRDWIQVDDAADLLLQAAAHASTACPVANGGTGLATMIADVTDIIARRFGSGAPRFSGRSRPGDPTDYQADISQALAWGWRPRQAWQDQIGRYVDWYRSGAP